MYGIAAHQRWLTFCKEVALWKRAIRYPGESTPSWSGAWSTPSNFAPKAVALPNDLTVHVSESLATLRATASARQSPDGTEWTRPTTPGI